MDIDHDKMLEMLPCSISEAEKIIYYASHKGFTRNDDKTALKNLIDATSTIKQKFFSKPGQVSTDELKTFYEAFSEMVDIIKPVTPKSLLDAYYHTCAHGDDCNVSCEMCQSKPCPNERTKLHYNLTQSIQRDFSILSFFAFAALIFGLTLYFTASAFIGLNLVIKTGNASNDIIAARKTITAMLKDTNNPPPGSTETAIGAIPGSTDLVNKKTASVTHSSTPATETPAPAPAPASIEAKANPSKPEDTKQSACKRDNYECIGSLRRYCATFALFRAHLDMLHNWNHTLVPGLLIDIYSPSEFSRTSDNHSASNDFCPPPEWENKECDELYLSPLPMNLLSQTMTIYTKAQIVTDALFNFILLILYGAAGSTFYVLKNMASGHKHFTYLKRDYIDRMLRILLGAISGYFVCVILRQTGAATELAMNQHDGASVASAISEQGKVMWPLLIAFLGGYSIDLFINLIHKLLYSLTSDDKFMPDEMRKHLELIETRALLRSAEKNPSSGQQANAQQTHVQPPPAPPTPPAPPVHPAPQPPDEGVAAIQDAERKDTVNPLNPAPVEGNDSAAKEKLDETEPPADGKKP